MLAIQPVSMNTYPQKVSFQRHERADFEDDKEFFEQQKREIEGLIDDDRLPKGMKKFLKGANVITDGLISGFTVACATIASANCGKNTFTKIKSNKFFNTVLKGFEPIKQYAAKGIKLIKSYAGKIVRKLLGDEKGQKVVNFAKNTITKVEKFFNKLNPFESTDKFDKATAKTATGLGVGAGVASAYAKTVERSEEDAKV